MRDQGAPADDLWHVGLAGWVLQDGNYPDFAVGDQVDFALEFWTDDAVVEDPGLTTCAHVRENEYRVTGALRQLPEVAVLDLALLAYSETRLPRLRRRHGSHDDGVRARVHLSVDHFGYFENYAHDQGCPPMIYGWSIESIWIETGPMINVWPGDPRYVGPDEGAYLIRDSRRSGWAPLAKTDVWVDGETHPSYLLDCRLVDPVPQRARRTSTAAT